MMRRLLLALLLLAIAPVAQAAGGVTEINQARAIAGGVTVSDTAGFPVTLTGQASYVLTSDLVVSDPNVSAIDVAGNEITLDLNGFALIGPVSCSGAGSAISCAPSGTGLGISGGNDDFVTVRNGLVRGFAGVGVRLDDYGRVAGVVSQENGGDGFYVGEGTLVRGCVATHNGGHGFQGDAVPLFRENVARSNGGTGLLGDLGSVFLGNASYDNGVDGVAGLFGANVIHGNVASNNENDGMRSSAGGIVTRNVINGSGNWGLFLNSAAGYSNNMVQKPGTGAATVTGGFNLGGNRCLDGTTQTGCP